MTRIGGLLITATGSVLLTAKEVKEVEDHIDQLTAENERLRRCVESHDEWGEGFRTGCDAVNAVNDETIEHYKSENEELRELVSDLMPIVCDGCHERLCDMPKEEHPFVECLFDLRMRELGIEVDK